MKEVLALSYETGVRMHVARSHFGLGDVSFAQDKFIQARRYYKEGLKLSEEMGDKIGNAYSLQQLANIELKQRNFDKAYGYFEESMIMNRETGNTIGMTESLVGIIKVLLEKNEFVLATKLSGSVMQSLDSSGRVLGKIEQELLSQINIKLKKEFSEDNYEKYLKEGMNMSLEEASKTLIDN
ncbi:MAG: tetratricopeptide repeat protein [Ignavibacteria bacterium]